MSLLVRSFTLLVVVEIALIGCHRAGEGKAQTISSAAATGSYSTTFDRPEKPLSENGAWRRAKNAWTDVQTANGVAYGTNGVTNTYDDSYALLAGSFGPDQSVEAIVYRDPNLKPGRTHEVELLLRFADDDNNARGYECLFNWAGGVQIMRWNGPFGDFTEIEPTQRGYLGRPLATGDVIKATINRKVISLYINGALMARGTDSTFKSGQPGISFFVRPGGSPAMLGLKRYSVTSK